MRYFWNGEGDLTLGEDLEQGRRLGRADVRVQVLAASINTRDLLLRRGRYPVPMRAGVTPLSDGVGRVVEIGSEVTRLAVGDRVCGVYFPEWQSGLMPVGAAIRQLGCTVEGFLTDERVFDQAALVKPPGHLTDEEAACLPCAMVTAWNGVHGMARRIESGQYLSVIGSGDVALAALGFAKAAGARTIAISSQSDRTEILQAAGADAVVISAKEADWTAAVRSETGNVGVDLMVETVGALTFERSLRALAPNAQLALIGAMGGQNIVIDAGVIGAAYCTVRRIFVGSRADFEAMNQSLTRTGGRPIIAQAHDFADAAKAFDAAEAGSRPGKHLIRIGDRR